MKKVLSLVLAIAMVLSSMSFAFAGTFTDLADNDYEEAIETLKALGVIDGYEDGSFKPEKTVTRAEMAKLMVQLLGYGDVVTGQKSNFSDTQGHWADQWIALAAGRGIVVGTGNGKFNPDGIVSYDQVLTMLVRGLGYTDTCNELKNMTWPTNFKVKAAELNITKNVDMVSNEADRGGVAQAMYNSLSQQLVKVNSDGDIVREYVSVGSNDKIAVNLISRIAVPDYNFKVGFEHINPSDKKYAGNKVDLSQYLFQTVEAYFNKNNDKEVVYVGEVKSLTYTDDFEDRSVPNNELEVGDYKFKVSGATISYNNAEISKSDFDAANLDDSKITVVLAPEDANGKTQSRVKDGALVDGIIVLKPNTYVQIEETYENDATVLDGIYLPVKNKKVDSQNLIIKGDATKLEDIEKNDIVGVYSPYDKDATVKATDNLTLVVSKATVEGKVTGTGDDAYYVDKKKYNVNDELGIDTLQIGDEGTFYLDDNGKIIAFKGESEGDKTYAVVEEMTTGRFEYNTAGTKATVTRSPKVKLNTASNETITYSLDVEIEKNDAGTFVITNQNIKDLFSNLAQSGAGDQSITVATSKDLTGKLVSYSIDSKTKEITDIKEVGREINMKTNSKSFVLASNAVIFNSKGDVISESKLGTTVEGIAEYKNGKIVALYAKNTEDDQTYQYAYINSVYADTDEDGDKVQRVSAYLQGSKKDFYTSEKNIVKNFNNDSKGAMYLLGLNDDNVIQSSTTTLADVVTGTAVKAEKGSGKVTVTVASINKDFYFDTNAGTIIKIKTNTDGSVNKVESVNNVNGIAAGKSVSLYKTVTGYDNSTSTATVNDTINFIIIWE